MHFGIVSIVPLSFCNLTLVLNGATYLKLHDPVSF